MSMKIHRTKERDRKEKKKGRNEFDDFAKRQMKQSVANIKEGILVLYFTSQQENVERVPLFDPLEADTLFGDGENRVK